MAIPLRVKKLIKSLQLKKYRKEEQCFIVEGAKSVSELLASDFEITLIAATDAFIEEHDKSLRRLEEEAFHASEAELASAGSLQSNEAAIAIARMKPNQPPAMSDQGFVLVLDDIRDPGNLGTIIRTADWYGIQSIIASEETADFYNPKTIGASMGSFTRVHVFYTDLAQYLKDKKNVYGTFLDGKDVHKVNFSSQGYLVIGNESNGISPDVSRVIHERICIPQKGKAESLNAAIATAVILDNLVR